MKNIVLNAAFILLMLVSAKSVMAIAPFEHSGEVTLLSSDIRQIIINGTRYELADPLLVNGKPFTGSDLPFSVGSQVGITIRQQDLGRLPVVDEIWLLDTQEGDSP